MAGKMPGVENTLPMMAGDGPYGSIEMGGMFTVIKVRAGISHYGDPGWYEQPKETRVRRAEPGSAPPEWRGEGGDEDNGPHERSIPPTPPRPALASRRRPAARRRTDAR